VGSAVFATKSHGSQILLYQTASTAEKSKQQWQKCAPFAGLGFDFVKDLPPVAGTC